MIFHDVDYHMIFCFCTIILFFHFSCSLFIIFSFYVLFQATYFSFRLAVLESGPFAICFFCK